MNGQDTSEAFYFQYVVRETHYRELIRCGDSLSAAGGDSITPALQMPSTVWFEIQGVIYRNGHYLFIVYDRTAGDTLNQIEHYPEDTTARVRRTVIQDGIISVYNAQGEFIASVEAQSQKQQFREIIERILADSVARAQCDASMIIGGGLPTSRVRRFIDSASSYGMQVTPRGNNCVLVSMPMPDSLGNGKSNPLAGGFVHMLIDTNARRLLFEAVYGSDSSALTITCYFYDSTNNLVRECIESFQRLDDGTEIKSVVIREYLNRSFVCYLKEE